MDDFEGTPIHAIEAKIPAISVEMLEGYRRGTRLVMEVEFRVRSMRYEENRKGDLIQQLVLACEDISLKKVLTSADEVTLLGTVESDGIPTDFGQSPESPQNVEATPEIEGQESLLDAPDSEVGF